MISPVVVLTQSTESSCLRYALRKWYSATEPERRVLIAPRSLDKFAETYFCELSLYDDSSVVSAKELYPFEPFHHFEACHCIRRWFALNQWWKRNQTVGEILAIDHDVMLLSGWAEAINSIPGKLAGFDRSVAGTTLIRDQGILAGFCAWTLAAIKSAVGRKLILDCAAQYGWKVSDMTLWECFCKELNLKPTNLFDLDARNFAFDWHIGMDNGCEVEVGHKKLYIRHGEVYCKQLATGKEIRLHSLHFCENYKSLVPEIYQQILES